MSVGPTPTPAPTPAPAPVPKPSLGQKILAAFELLVHGLAQLEIPTYATAAAGLILPILTIFGVTDLSPAELAGDIVLFGLVAGAVEKLFSGQAKAHAARKLAMRRSGGRFSSEAGQITPLIAFLCLVVVVVAFGGAFIGHSWLFLLLLLLILLAFV